MGSRGDSDIIDCLSAHTGIGYCALAAWTIDSDNVFAQEVLEASREA